MLCDLTTSAGAVHPQVGRPAVVRLARRVPVARVPAAAGRVAAVDGRVPTVGGTMDRLPRAGARAPARPAAASARVRRVGRPKVPARLVAGGAAATVGPARRRPPGGRVAAATPAPGSPAATTAPVGPAATTAPVGPAATTAPPRQVGASGPVSPGAPSRDEAPARAARRDVLLPAAVDPLRRVPAVVPRAGLIEAPPAVVARRAPDLAAAVAGARRLRRERAHGRAVARRRALAAGPAAAKRAGSRRETAEGAPGAPGAPARPEAVGTALAAAVGAPAGAAHRRVEAPVGRNGPRWWTCPVGAASPGAARPTSETVVAGGRLAGPNHDATTARRACPALWCPRVGTVPADHRSRRVRRSAPMPAPR
jgi:hypothetical protein